MALFAAISPEQNDRLRDAITREFPDANFTIAPGQFLISTDKVTTRDVAEKLGVLKGDVGRVLVMNVTNQTGWHSKDMWEWIAVRNAIIRETS